MHLAHMMPVVSQTLTAKPGVYEFSIHRRRQYAQMKAPKPMSLRRLTGHE